MKAPALVAWAALVLVVGTAPVQGLSPGLPDQPQTFPWTVGLGPAVVEEAGGLEPGGLRLKTQALWFNTYRQYGLKPVLQRIDLEGLLPSVSAAWSPAQGWELRGQAQGWVLGGGFMDRWLSAYHTWLGLPNQGRDLVPDNAFTDYWSGVLNETRGGAGLTQASTAVRAFAGPWAATVWVKLPVPAHRGWGWSGAWGGGAGLGWGERWSLEGSPWVFGAGTTLALVVVGDEPALPGQRGPWAGQVGSYISLGYGAPRVVVEGTWTSNPRAGDGYAGMGAGLLTTAVQIPAGADWTFELTWTEEFFTWATNETGFGAGLTVSYP